jgi:hypothetical protein
MLSVAAEGDTDVEDLKNRVEAHPAALIDNLQIAIRLWLVQPVVTAAADRTPLDSRSVWSCQRVACGCRALAQC